MKKFRNLFLLAQITLSCYLTTLFAEEKFDIVLQPHQKYEMELAKLKAEKEYLSQLLNKNQNKNELKSESGTSNKNIKRKRIPYLSVRIDISQQKMRVIKDGRTLYVWPALTGLGYNPTPTGIFKPKFIRQEFRSEACHREFMPHAIFLDYDLAIYGTMSIYKPTMRLMHNCIRISPINAKILYKLVQKYGAYRTMFNITR